MAKGATAVGVVVGGALPAARLTSLRGKFSEVVAEASRRRLLKKRHIKFAVWRKDPA